MVLWWQDGVRHRKFFVGRAAAEAYASTIRDHISRLSASLFAEFDRMSVAECESLALCLRDARVAGVTIRQVWEEWSSTRPPDAQASTVSLGDAVSRFISARASANLRRAYLESLRQYLSLFSRGREALPLSKVNPQLVSEWFTLRKEPPASMRSNLGRLSAFFAWASRTKLLPANPCDAIERPRVDHRSPNVLTVRQAARLLGLCVRVSKPLTPWLVLCLLAGLRPEEADKTTWDRVDLEAGHVVVDSSASKVRQRRIVNLEPVARSWLRWARSIPMPLTKAVRRKYQRALRQAYGWDAWPQDVLRHTCASYLLALHQDAGKVARTLGNSASILLTHYHALVTRQNATRFWSRLTPPKMPYNASEGKSAVSCPAIVQTRQ